MVIRLLLVLLLSGCSWSPDPNQIPCQDSDQCPPGWGCRQDLNLCALGIDDDDAVDDDDATDDDDSTDDDDTSDDDDDVLDDDDFFNDDDDSDAAASLVDQRYCINWDSVTLAENPLDLVSDQILDFPFQIHFTSVSEGNVELQAYPGSGLCELTTDPTGEQVDYTFFQRDWSFTPGNGHLTAGPITRLQVATLAGLGLLFDPVITATYDAANNRFVQGTLVGELWITPVLNRFPTISCDNAPGCHPCPGIFNDEDCITVEASDAIWTHAGSGPFP